MEEGLRLGGALWRFWSVRGYLAEGRERLAALLAPPPAEGGTPRSAVAATHRARTAPRAKALACAGILAYYQGDFGGARSLLEESLAIKQDLGDKLGIAECLAVLAEVASSRGQMEQAARLFGAAEALREILGAPRPRSQRAGVERHVTGVRAALGQEAFAAAWAAGRAMTLSEAVADALASPDAPSGEGDGPASRCPGPMGQPGDAAAAKLSALGAS